MNYPLITKPHEVQAILAGRQSQFRRIVKLPNGRVSKKPQAMPDCIGSWINSAGSNLWAGFGSGEVRPDGVQNTVNTMRTGWFACPFGKVGARLWVWEKYFPMRYDWKELPGAPILYSDGSIRNRNKWGEDYQGAVPPMGHAWKQAVTMPYEASRILLEISVLRIERLHSITRSDIRTQGLACPPELCSDEISPNYKDWYPKAWQDRWVADNGPESWAANPWVWVVEFKVIEPAPTSTIKEGTETK